MKFKRLDLVRLVKDVKCESEIMQESQEGETATDSKHIVHAIRNAHRQAGIIGLLSPCHMPINELFRGVRVRVSFQSVQQIQSSFFSHQAASFKLRHLASGWSLAGSRKLLSKLTTYREAEAMLDIKSKTDEIKAKPYMLVLFGYIPGQ